MPYYYATRLDDSLILTESTPTERCGYFRFKFPSAKPVVLLATRKGGDLTLTDGKVVSGVERFNDIQAFVDGKFSSPVTAVKTTDGPNAQLAVSGAGETLEFRYGVSFISVEQAKKNPPIRI